MITEEKHDQRMEKIAVSGDAIQTAAIALMESLKKFSNISNNTYANIQKFENQIRGMKSGT